MRMLRTLAWGTVCLLGSAAQAQLVTVAPAAALACMTPPAEERGTPVYPAEMVRRKDGGLVRVELTFTSPDREPSVQWIGPHAGQVLMDSVREHVSKLRVPCLPPGAEPARIVMGFDFLPNDGRKVMATRPEAASAGAESNPFRCMTRIVGGEVPEYPSPSRRLEEQGNFLVEMRFDSPTEAPKHTIVAGPRFPNLRYAIDQFVPGYRLPCLSEPGARAHVIFKFRMDQGQRTVINDVPLQTLVGAAAKVPQPAYFDLNALGCPFDVRITYKQPYLPSDVGELGESRLARRALLDWLAGIELRLDAAPHTVLGQQFTVGVPCGTIDL